MKAKAAPFPIQPESREPTDAERPLLPDEDVLTDEEAFYAAQDVAFAEWRARNDTRPRRKL